ncbi:hypothetical protein [Tsukamurella soli]|uniref:hypothetical protein n=1 Tax=Tsukamurella soli TaxID=644556 RepID=UPI003623184D
MSSFMQDLASDMEFGLAQRLETARLYLELNHDENEIRRVQELYGRLARSAVDHGVFGQVAARYPAITLCALCGHAALGYEAGAFWESFWERAEVPREQRREEQVRHAVPGLLAKFGLVDFDGLAGPEYLARLAMQAGIPVHCLEDLVGVIEDHVRAGREESGAEVLAWLTASGMEHRLTVLDAPVQNFLRHGGVTARAILDRIIEFLKFTQTSPEVWNDLELVTETTGLPTLLLDALIDRVHRRPFLAQADGGSADGARRARTPELRLSADDGAVEVLLPYPGGDSPWRVTMGGSTQAVPVAREWGVIDAGDQPPTPVAVPGPVPNVVARWESEPARAVTVVDPADPLLLFRLDGRLLRPTSVLPQGEVTAVWPGDATVVGVADDGAKAPVRVIDQLSPPDGWRGWRRATIDIAGCAGLRVVRGELLGPVRRAAAAGAPRVTLRPPVPGVRTTGGAAVFADGPVVSLPAGAGACTVTVNRTGDLRVLTSVDLPVTGVAHEVSPFDALSAGLGHFDVRVRRAVGDEQVVQCFVAVGLTARFSSPLRIPVAGGLSEVTAEFSTKPGVSVDRTRIPFGTADRTLPLEVCAEGHSARLMVTPLHVELRYRDGAVPGPWRSTAVQVVPDELATEGFFELRVPVDAVVTFVVRDTAKVERQREDVKRTPEGLYRVSTRLLADTAVALIRCDVIARIVHDGGTRSVVVARVGPARLCSRVDLVDGHLVFADLSASSDVAAAVWLEAAPWRGAQTVEIADGRAALPEESIGAGPLRVDVFVDDPWALGAAPEHPGEDAFRVLQPGWPLDDDAGRRRSRASSPATATSTTSPARSTSSGTPSARSSWTGTPSTSSRDTSVPTRAAASSRSATPP